MSVAACIGHSTARWTLETLETIEAGVFCHSDPSFLGGGSIGTWYNQIDPQGAKWDTFESDVDGAGGVDAVWVLIVARNPSSFPGEPYLMPYQMVELLTFARTITGNVPYFISAMSSYQACASTGAEQHEKAIAYRDILLAEANTFAGPRLLPITELLTYDGCHANDPLRNDQALIVQSWFGAGGSAWG